MNGLYQSQKSLRHDKLLEKAKSYMLDNIESKHSLIGLARKVGSNHSTMNSIFSEKCGCGPMKWLRVKRMEKAKLLLETTSRDIQDIAFEVGYHSASCFTTAYKAYHQRTPTEDRRKSNSSCF